MKSSSNSGSTPTGSPPPGIRPGLLGALVVGAVLILAWAFFGNRGSRPAPGGAADPGASGVAGGGGDAGGGRWERPVGGVRWSRAGKEGARSPEAVVNEKAAGFARARRSVAESLARKAGVDLSSDAGRFFAAAESGNWGDIKGLYNTLSSQRYGPQPPADLVAIWPAIQETFGAVGVARSWPAEELLAYGESVLSSLRPGTVYLAGSDAGRYVPTLMEDTAGGSRAMVMSPEALLDPSFASYVEAVHGDRLAIPTQEDLARAQQTRASDPRRSGGSTPTVLQALMDKNPNVNFAVEGTIPADSLPGQVVPLGPVFELRGGDGGAETLTAERAAESAQYWQATAQRLQGATALEPDSETRRSYAQLASAQADLFARNNLMDQAEQAYRAAYDIAPGTVDAVARLAKFLAEQGRAGEALQTLDTFSQNFPGMAPSVDGLRQGLTSGAGTPRK